jgi:hypothetical protein
MVMDIINILTLQYVELIIMLATKCGNNYVFFYNINEAKLEAPEEKYYAERRILFDNIWK